MPVSLTALLQRVPDWWVAVRERLVGLVPEWPAKQERADHSAQAGSTGRYRGRYVRRKSRSSTARVQVVAEAVEQIAVPMIPKIQPPMKGGKRATPDDEPAARWPRARPSQMAMSCLTAGITQ